MDNVNREYMQPCVKIHHGNGGCIDAKPFLKPAYAADYTQIVGIGGTVKAGGERRKRNVSSSFCISVYKNNQMAKFNLSVFDMLELYNVAKHYMFDAPAPCAVPASNITSAEIVQAINTLNSFAPAYGGESAHAALYEQLAAMVQKVQMPTQKAQGKEEFVLIREKINTYKEDKNTGLCPKSKFKIRRAPYRNDGSVAENPWSIEIQEGSAKAKNNKIGGAYAASGTYVKGAETYINLNDEECYMFFMRMKLFFDAWKIAYSASIIANGEQYWDATVANQNASAYNVNAAYNGAY